MSEAIICWNRLKQKLLKIYLHIFKIIFVPHFFSDGRSYDHVRFKLIHMMVVNY